MLFRSVSDRVMGDINVAYKPDIDYPDVKYTVSQPRDLNDVQGAEPVEPPTVGMVNVPADIVRTVVRRRAWRVLKNKDENKRLCYALIELNTGHKLE